MVGKPIGMEVPWKNNPINTPYIVGIHWVHSISPFKGLQQGYHHFPIRRNLCLSWKVLVKRNPGIHSGRV